MDAMTAIEKIEAGVTEAQIRGRRSTIAKDDAAERFQLDEIGVTTQELEALRDFLTRNETVTILVTPKDVRSHLMTLKGVRDLKEQIVEGLKQASIQEQLTSAEDLILDRTLS